MTKRILITGAGPIYRAHEIKSVIVSRISFAIMSLGSVKEVKRKTIKFEKYLHDISNPRLC